MLRDVYLYGALGRKFGRHFRLAVDTPVEAVRALITLRPELRALIRLGYWRVIVGKPHLSNATTILDLHCGNQAIHFVPATPPAGGDGGNIGKIIVGVVIIVAAVILAIPSGGTSLMAGVAALGTTGALGVSFGTMALLGASMVFMGVAGLLTQPVAAEKQQATDNARPEDRPSFMFNGVTNNTQQGGPVPLVFGRHLTGSTVVSGGIAVEDIAV
jgi:predicted phage tail protein